MHKESIAQELVKVEGGSENRDEMADVIAQVQ